MIFRAAIAVSLLFPLVGVFLLELGFFGPDISQSGHPNGATLALATYSMVMVATIYVTERYGFFHTLGARAIPKDTPAPLSNLKIIAILAPMAALILFSAGGLQTIMGERTAGSFRVGLTSSTGVPSYLILKYYAPATFAYVALEQAKHGRLWSSTQLIIAGLLLILISISFGYKTAIVMAMLPAVTVVCWRASLRTVMQLGIVASLITVAAYLLMTNRDLPATLDAIFQRLFLWHGGVPWKVWEMYINGTPFPSYINTLPTIFSDRLYTMMTGVTRANETAWVMSHFNLMATNLATSAYTPEYILRDGHNNAANAFSEGIIAYGITGAFIVALIAGLIANALYHLIDNKLRAQDLAAASLAACYLFSALMPWLLGGGIVELVHSSVIFGALTGYLLLRCASINLRRSKLFQSVVKDG